MIRIIFILLILILACEDVNRIWDNPYDPRSDRTLWTPDSLYADTSVEGKITLNWQRKGRDFDGFKIDRKVGNGEWKDSVVTLWDSIFTWTDILEMKSVVQNKNLYSYRLYAYADTNRSNMVTVTANPLIPDPPGPVQINSIIYADKPPKTMTIEWTKSNDGSFKQYNLYHSDNENSTFGLYRIFYDVDTNSMDTTGFTVLKENWFRVGVVDTTGQETIGDSKGIPVDPPPSAVILDSIKHANSSFNLNWTETDITDFSDYSVQEINILDSSVIGETKITTIGTLSKSLNISDDVERYYRIKLNDVWGNGVNSQIRPASSYQRIVKVDYIRDIGDDITIRNSGPTLPFTQLLSNVNAQFPVWIQNGNKIFAFIDGGMGLIVNQNGSGLRTISGEVPQNVAFNPDQTLAVYAGADHNIYLTYLEKDQGPIRITNSTNNEWFLDPEFFDNGNKILYSQRKHQANNNVGVIDVFTMDLDGLNITQITTAPNVDKFIMPRLSPAENKMLYVKEEDGLYILDFPTQSIGTAVLKSGNVKVVPESNSKFRNIRWSPDGDKAVLWSKENGTYFLYIYDNSASPPLKLLQSGGRYGDWISNDTVLFRYESSDAMYKKAITEDSGADPILFYDAPWAQLQPRQ
ncbi:MAG: hypothetical protein OXR70_00550 [Candidatus Marinimicrobia bacterium]|nr:hypothetical protein [Candidatus Neomarinimicrobiota bacterium]